MDNVIAGRYLIEGEVGSGGMGIVYQATDLQTSETVAIKQLKTDMVNAALVERFRREGAALRELNHPNIVKMFDAIDEDDDHYLIMEFVPGGDVSDLIRRNEMSVEQVLRFGIDLADALTRAHKLNIIHRDLKPANVLVAEDGTLRLTDFGVANIGNQNRLTATDAIIGTVAYLPPEAFDDRPIDARSDIWAFGIILFEMLTGQTPTKGQSVLSAIQHILNDPIPDVKQYRDHVPDRLISLINRMLKKDPEARPQSVRLVGAELEAILQGKTMPERFSIEGWAQQFATETVSSAHKVHNLPAQVTPFIGRKREIEALTNLLRRAEVRLVTLTGVGGTGKTRLSIEVATQLEADFPDDVIFVELASVHDPEQFATTLSTTLDVSTFPDETPIEAISRTLRDREVLLVFDNFEQIIEAATDVAALIAGTQNLKIMVSSRRVLRVSGEHVYPVPPMDMPVDNRRYTAQVYGEYEAVRLFVDQARAVTPGFDITDENASAVVEICNRLDGLPLAISLIAARLRLFSPQQLLSRMESRLKVVRGGGRDVPQRQRTLRDAIQWSYDLLSPDEQILFRLLSVFVDGWSIEAAEAVVGDETDLDVVEGLETLLDNSLIIPLKGVLGLPRFTMLETIREYASEALDASGEAGKVQDALLDYYLAWSDGGSDQTGKREMAKAGDIGQAKGANLSGWLRFREESENIVKAARWAIQSERYMDMLQLFRNTHFFADRTLAVAHIIPLVETALEKATDIPEDLYIGVVGLVAWELAHMSDGKDRAKHYAQIAMEKSRETGNDNDLMLALQIAAIIADDAAEEVAIGEQMLELQKAQDNEDTYALGVAYGNLASSYVTVGNLKRARELYDTAISLFEPGPSPWTMYTLGLANVERWEGNYARAHELLSSMEQIWREMDTPFYSANLDGTWGDLVLAEGDHKRALGYYSASLRSAQQASSTGYMIEAILGLTYVAIENDDYERAAKLIGAYTKLAERFEYQLGVLDEQLYSKYVDRLRDQLDDDTYAKLVKEGEQMSLEMTINYALDSDLAAG